MSFRNLLCGLGAMAFLVHGSIAATPVERLRNEKVLVVEETLAPGDALSLPGDKAGVVVYLDSGSVETALSGALPVSATVRRGKTEFQSPRAGTIRNSGSSELGLVWVEFLGQGGAETWRSSGLVSNINVLFENRYARVYEIWLPAGSSEGMHSQNGRVAVCLSGAELLHDLPDGRHATAVLKTGEITWRASSVHAGHNLSKTDLWVIGIEPK